MPNYTDRNDLVEKAEAEISAILAKLETETGSVIDSIDIRDLEVTQFQDTRPQWLRSVVIDMKRLPGTFWSK